MTTFKKSSNFINYQNGVSYYTTYFEIDTAVDLTPNEYFLMQDKLNELYNQIIDEREKNTDETL